MENKSCRNCRYVRACGIDNTPCEEWQPDYQTLESQLFPANELIKEQIEVIYRYQKALMLIVDLWDIGRDGMPEVANFIYNFNSENECDCIDSETSDMFVAREIADEALCHN